VEPYSLVVSHSHEVRNNPLVCWAFASATESLRPDALASEVSFRTQTIMMGFQGNRSSIMIVTVEPWWPRRA
jgi:hypothetical protein